MWRTMLNFGKLDWTNLLEMTAVGMLFRGAATKAEDVFIAGERDQRTSHGSAK
jgi:hypothetical protein